MRKTKRQLVAIIRNAYAFDFGGGERFPNFLAKTLIEHTSYQAIVISRSRQLLAFANQIGVPWLRGWWWSWQNWSGWRVVATPAYILWQIMLILWYLQLFIRLRPSVVHPQSKDDFIAATVAGRLVGARIVWSDFADLKHIWMNVRLPFKNPVGKMVYAAAMLAHAITAVSDADRALIVAHLSPKSRLVKKIVTVHNGVHDRLADYPPGVASDTVVFACASRLVRDKGITELIKAFQHLHAQHPNTKLVLMGDGPERSLFETMRKPNDGIEMTGHLDDPLVRLAHADVFVHPTYHEGFSIALIEASMMAKAIIATNVGGNPEIIQHNQTGLLVPAQDANALYNAMQTLYANPALRDRLAKKAREHFVESLTLERVVAAKFVPLYKPHD